MASQNMCARFLLTANPRGRAIFAPQSSVSVCVATFVWSSCRASCALLSAGPPIRGLLYRQQKGTDGTRTYRDRREHSANDETDRGDPDKLRRFLACLLAGLLACLLALLWAVFFRL